MRLVYVTVDLSILIHGILLFIEATSYDKSILCLCMSGTLVTFCP